MKILIFFSIFFLLFFIYNSSALPQKNFGAAANFGGFGAGAGGNVGPNGINLTAGFGAPFTNGSAGIQIFPNGTVKTSNGVFPG